MKKKKVVIALGGNAIQSGNPTAEAQQKALEKTAEQIVSLIEENAEIIITHGNGPQVGNILLQQKAGDSPNNPAMPLDACGAMSEGLIGYWLQNAMDKALKKHGIQKNVSTVITRVQVDPNDRAFRNPTKPIGPFYTEDEAKRIMTESNAVFKADAGRGWRRVVPSPAPINICEYQTINSLVEDGNIVIAVGGGGIPVIETPNGYEGIEAVIDKDFAAQKLAELVEADILMILTTVDHVYINYNKPTQQKLTAISVSDLENYVKEDQFAPGSMLPKIEAAIQFADSSPNRQTIITSLDRAYEAFQGKCGTIITKGAKSIK